MSDERRAVAEIEAAEADPQTEAVKARVDGGMVEGAAEVLNALAGCSKAVEVTVEGGGMSAAYLLSAITTEARPKRARKRRAPAVSINEEGEATWLS